MTDQAKTPDGQDLVPTLKRRHQRFADLYLTGLSGAQCMREMKHKGARPDHAAYRILKRADVQAYISHRRRSEEEQFGLRKESIVRSLGCAATADIRAYFNSDGKLKAIQELPDELALAISSVEVEDMYEGRGESRECVGQRTVIKLRDGNRAAEVVSRVMGWNRDKLSVLGSLVPPIIEIVPYEDDDPASPAN